MIDPRTDCHCHILPGPDAAQLHRFWGWKTIKVDWGVPFSVEADDCLLTEDCYGYADKNWGRDFTSPWVWLSSNNLTSEITGKKLTDSVFDIGVGTIQLFDRHGNLVDRIHAENIGCEYGEYSG